MYRTCVTQASLQRQRELERGLLEFMLHHQYENISVSELCDSMDIPRKAFYRYFSSKEGALYALIDHTLLDFVSLFFSDEDGNPKVMDRSMSADFFRYWLTKKELLRALNYSNLSGLLVQRSIELLRTHGHILDSFMSFIPMESREYVLLFLVSGIMSLLVQWQNDNFKKTPEEMGRITVHILTQSFLP